METLTLYGVASASIQLLLSEATDPEEECPITLMPIADAKPLRENSRLNCARLVACGHRFSIVPLLVHFAHNQMRCPVCRGGVDQRLDPTRSLGAECATRHALFVADEDQRGEPLSVALIAMQNALDAIHFVAAVRLYSNTSDDASATVSDHRFPLRAARIQRATDLLTMRPRLQLDREAARQIRGARALRIAVLADGATLQSTAVYPIETEAPLALLMRGNRMHAALALSPSFTYIPGRRVLERFVFAASQE